MSSGESNTKLLKQITMRKYNPDQPNHAEAKQKREREKRIKEKRAEEEKKQENPVIKWFKA